MRSSIETVSDAFNRWAEEHGWATRADPRVAFEAPELCAVLSVWHDAAKGRALPARSDLTPRVMKSFLPNVAMVDVVKESERARFRLRLLGSELDRRFGAASGQFVDEAYPEPYRSRWPEMLSLPLKTGVPMRVSGLLDYRRTTPLKAEVFLAPLGASIEAPDAVLLVLQLAPNQDDPDIEPFPRLAQAIA